MEAERKMPEPAPHMAGYYYEDLVALFGKRFETFMAGQTMMLDAKNRAIVYKHDVDNFLAGGGKLDPFTWD